MNFSNKIRFPINFQNHKTQREQIEVGHEAHQKPSMNKSDFLNYVILLKLF